MTVNQVRKLLKTAADILLQAVPIILAIADAFSGRSSTRTPPQ